MPSLTSIIIILLTVNAITLLFFWWDKTSAKRSGWRVPESSLLMLALLGGSPAAFLAMRIFRHKTKKLSFRARFWMIVIAQIIGIIWFFANK